jgi:PIN domain nuclease of toxin-antitoxin system
MRVLLDTHAFLWFILDDPKLSTLARGIIEEEKNDILISPASFWEIAIKIRLKKYSLPQPYLQFMQSQIAVNEFKILPLELPHTDLLITLPIHHKDPFDRLLVCQSLAEGIPLVSADAGPDCYGVNRLW